jgi:predicted GNAT family acetyltransferase
VPVHLTDDPAPVLAAAGGWLAARPREHNLLLTLLDARVAEPRPGRYGWAVDDAGRVAGVVFQSPLDFDAVVAAATPAAAAELAEAVAGGWDPLPGLTGEAGAAAAFAGAYAAATGRPARPVEAQRLLVLTALREPPAPRGAARLAVAGDVPRLAGFVDGFHADVGEGHRPSGDEDAAAVAAALVAAGRQWVWDDGGLRAMASVSPPAAGVVRVSSVYTPPGDRWRGYGAAVTAAVSRAALAAGTVPVLYTQLVNPTSDAVYRRLGYEPVLEALRYSCG